MNTYKVTFGPSGINNLIPGKGLEIHSFHIVLQASDADDAQDLAIAAAEFQGIIPGDIISIKRI